MAHMHTYTHAYILTHTHTSRIQEAKAERGGSPSEYEAAGEQTIAADHGRGEEEEGAGCHR